MAYFLHIHLLIANFLFASPQPYQAVDLCELKGAVYIESVASLADYRVFVLEQEDFADLLVFKEQGKAFCEEAGHWFITTSRSEADFSIFLEAFADEAELRIFYTEFPSLAGCP